MPVLDLPDGSTFAALFADPKFPAALGIAALSGAVRGFSGFGTALVHIPLMSALFGPRVAAVSFVLMDLCAGWLFTLGFWRLAKWGEVLPMVSAAILAAQLGTLVLQYADPTMMRWIIVGFVFVVVLALSSGWRYHGTPALPLTLGVGALAGLLGGAVQMSGPPIIMYWLGMPRDPKTTRANFLCYFSIFSTALVVTYFLRGLVTAEVIALALCLAPFHIFSMWVGTQVFHLATERTYRRVAYVVILIAAIVSMPLFDGWLR